MTRLLRYGTDRVQQGTLEAKLTHKVNSRYKEWTRNMSGLTLSQNKGILPCPGCGEMIYSDAEVCRFCSAPIDRETATRGAELQMRVNNACNQAKWVRNAAGAMWLLLLLGMFLPAASWGFVGLFFAVPIWLITWQVRFRGLETLDADYQTAKRDWFIALMIWLPVVALHVISVFTDWLSI
ncbi:MAG TPA: hypothetical protein VJR02_11965 [Pyrinomonadaceae bacterium]|nr:hypothetical protein [Pyrinomonadaceae bacterium]